MQSPSAATRTPPRWVPGVAAAALAALVAWGIHWLVPAVPLLTAAVVLGIVVGQLPFARPAVTGALSPGLSVAAKRLMRIGVVLLGLKLSLGDIADLGWVTILSTVAIVLVTFVGTMWLGRLFRLPGHQPLLIATGFSICGASAIGAMSGVVKSKDEETATPVALVTLCGTLAIFVLPVLWHPLGLSSLQFGHWVGAGVHDVGQVVATAQLAGPASLAVAVVVKLTRVLMLAPMVAVASVVERRRHVEGDPAAKRPPIVPLFVAGFILAVLVASFIPLPEVVRSASDTLQTALLAMALFGLGTAVRLRTLLGTGWRALAVGLLSWAIIAALALAAVHLS
ncbi:putative sulfate exporter family transporter [Leifsonia sp. PS1209]|uniref:YeiH family protein n=1 Tax=Leifsonia sp. PS1209 TaxID=2724914 RepID=UPI001442E59A|nr:putative sulfate exporter family transporter [Leifsonia sp. PS1209]QIZ99323.1 putative sulfate exporter family transporter [Leifsonia sp. PS1209]